MFVLSWSKLSPKTKAAVLSVAGSVTFAQVTAVKDWIIPKLANHPHVSTIAGGMFIIAGILFNPLVRQALGLKQEEKKVTDPDTGKVLEQINTTSVVPLPEGTTGEGTLTTSVVPSKE
jgi:hypothetical protein